MAAFRRYFLHQIPTSATHSEKSSTCFDCNICLDFACDPVVTLCGHLYCWPCIYKWIEAQTTSLPSGQLPRCPVCKAETSQKAMVPLYGRGQSFSEQDHERKGTIPPRPPASGLEVLARNHPNRYDVREAYSVPHLSPVMSHPMVGMLGEMVYARVFGNAASLYMYPNLYRNSGSGTPRLRRREMEAEKSLNRVSLFLFCCFLLCLVLF